MDKQNLIDSVKFIFDAYEDLRVLPLAAWGRYYQYELSGSPFDVEGYQFADYHNLEIEDKRFTKQQWDLLKEIDSVEDDEFYCKVEDIVWPFRDECVKYSGFDDRGGMVLFVVKDDEGKLIIETASCDSPE